MRKISGVVICRNEEKNIEDCIKSILWCDEVIIIDGYSTDATVSIASQHTEKVFLNDWKGYAEQRKFALTKVSSEWALFLDADERCSIGLVDEIKKILSLEVITDNGFEIPRKNFFLDRWLKHGGWYPDYQMRFFRKEFADVSDRLVHEKFVVSGTTGKLKGHLYHFTVSSITDYVSKINSYSGLSAEEKMKKRKIGFFEIFIYPTLAFIQKYIFKGGFLDGAPGLMAAKFHSMTKNLNYMKLWEMQNKNKN